MWRFKGLAGARTGNAPEWIWSTSDSALAAGLLAATVAVCLPLGYLFHTQARSLDRQVEETQARSRILRSTLAHVENRKTDLARLRREVNRYVADVETRPMVPWSTAIGELSRRRPEGLWATRITGSGPQFRAQVAAMSPELVSQYARQLRESPYVDFAALPAGETPGAGGQVVGRLMGE